MTFIWDALFFIGINELAFELRPRKIYNLRC